MTDTIKVNEYIKSELQNNEQLRESYNKMQKMAKILEETKNSYYRYDHYQVYVAACLLARKKPAVLKLAAGAGKSFIIVMLALYYAKLNKTVTIVVPSPLLKKQML